MKKLYYLSIGYFSQVDTCILHLLSEKYDVIYGIIIPNKNSNFNRSELEEYCRKSNVTFEPFVISYRQRDLRLIFDCIKIFLKIRKSKPDLIYSVSLENPIFSLMCLLLDNKKTIIGMHDVAFHSNYPFVKIFQACRKVLVKHFKYFVVYSKNQEDIFKQKYAKKKVFNIPLPINKKAKIWNLEKKQEGNIEFLFFGNILPYKGLDILIQAVNKLSLSYSGFKLVIAGRCENWATNYEPLIQKGSLIESKIGFLSNDEIEMHFNNCHYLVLPYKDATQSGPLMLAYSYNVPVIASNIEAFREIVEDGRSGFLFDNGNLNDLIKVLESAILRSKKQYNDLLLTQQQFIDSVYSEQKVISDYENMFMNI